MASPRCSPANSVLAYRYHGKRYDCGSKLGLMQASVVLGESHPELGIEFSAWLKERQQTIDTPAAQPAR
jgi:UTP--glucose-1-phosphate uridylyltransferase